VQVVGGGSRPRAVRTRSCAACLAKGADRALRVWDDAIAGSDPIAIARILAAVARRESPDLVLAGAQSSDHGHATTGSRCRRVELAHVAVGGVGLNYGAGDAQATARASWKRACCRMSSSPARRC